MNANGATPLRTPIDGVLLELLGKYEDKFGKLPNPEPFKSMTKEQFADALRTAIAAGKPIDPADYPRPAAGGVE